MRYVKVPKAVELYDRTVDPPRRWMVAARTTNGAATVVEEPPWTMYTFLQRIVLADAKRFSSGYEATRASRKIAEAFDGAEEGTWVQLEDADWDLLVAGVKAPSEPWPAALAQQCFDFLEAVVEAPSKKPAELAPKELAA